MPKGKKRVANPVGGSKPKRRRVAQSEPEVERCTFIDLPVELCNEVGTIQLDTQTPELISSVPGIQQLGRVRPPSHGESEQEYKELPYESLHVQGLVCGG